jgi:hypothetical protein
LAPAVITWGAAPHVWAFVVLFDLLVSVCCCALPMVATALDATAASATLVTSAADTGRLILCVMTDPEEKMLRRDE